MKRNREIVVVEMPQVLENALGLAARVDKDKRGAVGLDQRVQLAERIARRMAGPRHPLIAVQHRHLRGRAAGRHDQIGARFALALRHHETTQVIRFGDGRREAGAGQRRRKPEQPGETE